MKLMKLKLPTISCPVLNKTFLRIPLRILYKFHRLSSLRTLEDGPLGTGSFGNDAHLLSQKIGSKTFASKISLPFVPSKKKATKSMIRSVALEFGDPVFFQSLLVCSRFHPLK